MSGRKVFTAGEVLQAADVNDYLMDQSVMVFAGTAARGSAIPSPTEGMVTYRSDDDVVEVYNGSSFVAVGPGQILQVVSTTKTDTFSAAVTSPSFTSNVTGLEASITPSSASSKILVQVSLSGARDGNYALVAGRLMRDSTAIGIGTSVGSRSAVTSAQIVVSGATANIAVASMNFLDSPSTTSSVTYGVQLTPVGGNTVFVNRSATDSDTSSFPRPVSTITLMEVAG